METSELLESLGAFIRDNRIKQTATIATLLELLEAECDEEDDEDEDEEQDM